MITVNGTKLTVSTRTLYAELENGVLTCLRSRSGRGYLANDGSGEALSAVYRGGEEVHVKNTGFGEIQAVSLSDTLAELRFDAWDANAVLTVSEDAETGDLLLEPEVTSARRGVLAARLYLHGIDRSLRLVAPFFQGVDMAQDDELLRGRKWPWPFRWEAGLAIFRAPSDEDGFWVRCEDRAYRAKSMISGLDGGSGCAFDSEAYGPVAESLSAGGIVWRVNVYTGSWRVPAVYYRDWLWRAYDLSKEEARRAPWTRELRMAVSWCPSDRAFVDALAARVDPRKVLLHLPNWRPKAYDTCYPDYTPSPQFAEFFKYASSLGFHCMPHANSIDMDPSMPQYRYVSDFRYRELEDGRFSGWSWYKGGCLGVPASNAALTQNRDKNVMIKVHPGLAMWRAILAQSVKDALTPLTGADAVFLDVALCTYNLDNCLVDNTTPFEGMPKLLGHVQDLGLSVGGEGLNELTFQHLSFGQVHLFDSFQSSAKGLERYGGCDLNMLLFGRLTRSFGYSNLGGRTGEQILRERVHEEHGCLPTITAGSAAEIEDPSDDFKRIFAQV